MKKVVVAVGNHFMSSIVNEKSNENRMTCWMCDENLSNDFFCSHCDSVQPLNENTSVFHYLGFEKTYSIDLAMLEKKYFDWQMRVHPDKFIGRSDEEKAVASSHSAFVNQAYKILKDSYLRAEHLLIDKGENIGHVSEFDAILLEEVMEKQELLVTLDKKEAIQDFMEREQNKINDLENELSLHFASDDFDAVRRVLKFLKYSNKLLEDARKQEKKISSSH